MSVFMGGRGGGFVGGGLVQIREKFFFIKIVLLVISMEGGCGQEGGFSRRDLGVGGDLVVY